MKTNCANNRCAEVHSSTCVKYTGSGSTSLGIYCDDSLNTVLDSLIAKVEELEAKVADTCRLSIAGIRISARNTAGVPTQMIVKLDNTDNRFTPIIYRVTSSGTEFQLASSSFNNVTNQITLDSLTNMNQSDFFRVTQGSCTAEFIMPNLGSNTADAPSINPL
jgi:hypothetical protein